MKDGRNAMDLSELETPCLVLDRGKTEKNILSLQQVSRNALAVAVQVETFEKCSILFKFKEGENFKHRNTLGILRIKI
jgi:D-serine deaminase-like pyridoxal phosphate-dependent protein